MRAIEFLNEAAKPKVGREFQHVEDLVYIDGPAGAKHAIERLRDLASGQHKAEIKWDGSPVVIFGRDESGSFHFGDKFAKNNITSPEELYALYLGRNKDPSEERLAFAKGMSELYGLYEQATPKDFRGYVEASLLYKDTPPLNKNNEYEFMPNTVKYFVDKNSDIGKRMGSSKTGCAMTAYMEDRTGARLPPGDRWKTIGSKDVLVLPPKYSESTAGIDTGNLDKIIKSIDANAGAIEQFIADEPGFSDIKAILYNYVNQQTAQRKLTTLGSNFLEWVNSNDKISNNKKQKIQNRIASNQKGIQAIFNLVKNIMVVKDDVIDQLESNTLKSIGIRAEIYTGEPGGEGLVSDPGNDLNPLKLVKRGVFTAANAEKGGR